MTRLIKKIDTQINLDKLKYAPEFNYKESNYASMEFPEIGNIDLFSIVSEPSKNSSQETKSELLYLSNLTKNLSQSQKDLVYKIDKNAGTLLEDFIKENSIKFPYNFFTSVFYTCLIAMVDHLKFYYNRPRPYQIADHYHIEINRIVTKSHKTPAYPSGHTMYAALMAEMIIDKYPQYKKQVSQLVDLCGKARELQGVHYPSDNTASKKIVKTIYPELKKYYIAVGVTDEL